MGATILKIGNGTSGGFVYGSKYNGEVNDIPNSITWSLAGGEPGLIHIQASNDNSTWTSIVPNDIEAGLANSATSYSWSLSSETDGTSHYDTLLGGLDSDNLYIRISTDGGDVWDDTSSAQTIRKVSIGAIIPNANFSGYNPATSSVYKDTIVNLMWTETYDANLTSVTIKVKDNARSSWTTVATNVSNKGGVPIIPSQAINTSGVEGTYGLGCSSNASSIRILVQGEDDHVANTAFSELLESETTGWKLSATVPDTALGDVYRKIVGRTDFSGTVAGEKGQRIDEFISLAQIEPMSGLTVYQRDIEGNLTFDATNDKRKAWNLVFKLDDYILEPRCREIQGTFNLITDGSLVNDASGDYQAGNSYGIAFKVDILHTWGLGNEADSTKLRFNQTVNSYDLTIQQVDGTGATKPATDVQLQCETRNADTIRIYGIVKGDALVSGNTVDSQVTNPKDQLSVNPNWVAGDKPTYDFVYRLKEIIPYNVA